MTRGGESGAIVAGERADAFDSGPTEEPIHNSVGKLGPDTTDIDGDLVTARLKWVNTQEGLDELVIATTDVRWL